jgi:small-conductance mechanosensitive channel
MTEKTFKIGDLVQIPEFIQPLDRWQGAIGIIIRFDGFQTQNWVNVFWLSVPKCPGLVGTNDSNNTAYLIPLA